MPVANRFGDSIWTREFEKAIVIVNPGKVSGEYTWDASARYCDVRTNRLQSPVRLKARTAMLLLKDNGVLR